MGAFDSGVYGFFVLDVGAGALGFGFPISTFGFLDFPIYPEGGAVASHFVC